MATKQTNALGERIEAQFTSLDEIVTKAEQSKDENKAMASLVGKLNAVLTFADGLDQSDKDKLVAEWQFLAGIKRETDKLRQVTGLDRSEGDALVAQLRAVVTLGETAWEAAGIDDPTERANTLIARWEATNTTTTTSTTSSKALGFSVQSKCECGFVRSTSKDNLNSHRFQLQTHEKDKHENTDTARGGEWHKGVTSALSSLMEDKSNHETHGRWTFDQVGR